MNHQFAMNCGLLRLFDQVSEAEDPRVPDFEYHHQDEGLTILRDKYGLASIAGQGDDWSRCANLMKWVFETTFHNGNSVQDVPMNALAILDYSFMNGKEHGVNCRKLATVLAEACLAVGLEARIVSLHPLNPYDFDNHVVTLVWCASLSRWVMLDPSFRAYLTDDAGQVLHPWEARKRLCAHQEVKCNADIGHNGESYKAEDYLTYIAKNLFYMHSPRRNCFGSETQTGRKWLCLSPEGFDVSKREAYNAVWRQHRGTRPWDDEVARAADEIRRRIAQRYDFTASVSSFFKAPVGHGVREGSSDSVTV